MQVLLLCFITLVPSGPFTGHPLSKFTLWSCNLRKLSQFYRPKVNSVYNGTESVSFLGPIICDLVQNELKDIGNLAVFKKAIKKWSPEKCSCRLCKVYISNVGFI